MYVCFNPAFFFDTQPYVCTFVSNLVNPTGQQPSFNQHHFLCTTHQQQAAHLKNTDTVTPPLRPSTSSGFIFNGECDCSTPYGGV
jgi:hypothetical protein